MPEDPQTEAWPGVAYVIPVLNEEAYLASAVDAILNQRYPGTKEIVLALGPSVDGTERVARQLAERDSRIVLVANPERDIPIGLNLAIRASEQPVIVRVDAHSELPPNYTRDAVLALQRTGASNIGGVMRAAGITPVQHAIANAYNSPIGLGGGTYHAEGEAGPAESAYLGVFTRSAYESVGGFNEDIRRGEDWEFNLRLRRAGHSVAFDPHLRVIYRPRSSFGDLGKQFFATGSWRATLVRMYRTENPWRFFVPGVYVLVLTAFLTVAGLWAAGVIERDSLWPLWLGLAPCAHLMVTLWAAIRAGNGVRDMMLTHVALVIMHIAWGTGFLVGALWGSSRIVDSSRLTEP